MSSIPNSIQDRNHLSLHKEDCSESIGHVLNLHSKERQAITASIDELDRSTYLSLSQQSAIESLRDLEESQVLEILSIIRLPGYVHHPYLAGLSKDNLDGLLHLRFCSDSLIILWLKHPRVPKNASSNPCLSGLPTAQRTVVSGSKSTLHRPLNSSIRPSSTSAGHSMTYSNETTHPTTNTLFSQHRFHDDDPQQCLSQRARSSCITERTPYVCVNIFCEKYVHCFVFKNCDDWKRHMKEHETCWTCMPNGPFEVAEMGLICVLCGSLDPNRTHMAGHSIGDCGNTSTKLRSFSRRMNLEKHLSHSHAVNPNRTRGIAGKWKKPLPKLFACGFCVRIFPTVLQQLNHIDMNHFRKGQQISEWSANTVIQSLLLSPEVANSFEDMSKSDACAVDRYPQWYEQTTRNLQKRLEIAEDAAKILALEAYRTLTLDRPESDAHHASTSIPGTDLIRQSGPFAAPAKGNKNNSDSQTEDLSQGSKCPVSWGDHQILAPTISRSKPDYVLPVNQSSTSEETAIEEDRKGYHTTPRDILAVSASNTIRPQPPCLSTLIRSESSTAETSSTSAYDGSGTLSPWQAVSSTTPSSLPSTEAAHTLGEQLRIHEGPVTHDPETTGMPIFDLDDLAQPPSAKETSLPFSIDDDGSTQQWSLQDRLNPHYDVNDEPEYVRKFLQYDRHYSTEPLTCDPRDLIKK